MNIKYVFLLICFSVFTYGQEIKWDDLSPNLKSHKVNDTTKIKLLIDATWYYNVRNYNDCLPLIKQANTIANDLNYEKGKGLVHLAYANFYIQKGDFQKANEDLLLAKAILIKTNNPFYLSEAIILEAKISKTYKNFKKGIHLLLELLDKEQLTLFQEARVNLELANLYMSYKSKELLNSKNYLELAKKQFTQIESNTGLALVNLKYGRFYKNYLFYYTDKLSKKSKKEYFLNSINSIKKALTGFVALNQKIHSADAYYNLALINSIVGKHKESVPYYTKSLTLYNELGNLFKEMKINQHLFIAHSILKNQKEAIVVNKQFILLKDAIFSIEKTRLIVDAQTKFDTEKIASEKRLLKAENEKNKKLFGASVVILMLLILSAMFYFGRFKAKKQAEITKIELEQTQKRLEIEKKFKNSELKALKSQMNPHFIFNALNSIQEYILSNKKNLAGDFLGKFADLIRSYLHFSELGEITIKEEVINLNLYLELEKLRFEDSLNYEFIIENEQSIEMLSIPTMIIQPYVENAIKHGLLHRKRDRKLKISIKKTTSNIIECIVEDNGIGREKSRIINENSNKKNKSFADKATKERLELLNFDKKQKIGVTINDVIVNNIVEGTCVILTIPILK